MKTIIHMAPFTMLAIAAITAHLGGPEGIVTHLAYGAGITYLFVWGYYGSMK